MSVEGKVYQFTKMLLYFCSCTILIIVLNKIIYIKDTNTPNATLFLFLYYTNNSTK